METATRKIFEIDSPLVRLCIDAACKSGANVDRWRRQRRTVERLPAPIASALLHRLLDRRLLHPSLFEIFKFNIEELDLRGESYVDAEWMAYLGAFPYLCSLNLADCHRISSSALWPITGMTSLKELNLSRCMKVTDAGIKHLLSVPHLEKLHISETGVTADGIKLLSSFSNLSTLDLGGLPVSDSALSSLQVLTELEYLDLWGSKISDKGAATLKMFPKLLYLNLAWTNVTELPNLKSLVFLNMSNCSICSVMYDRGDKSPLQKLVFHGATFTDANNAFLHIDMSSLSLLNLSNTSFSQFDLLYHMQSLEYLDLSHSMMGDDSIEMIAMIGARLKDLNLSNTKISTVGVGILAGNVPNLESISLSHTTIDDEAIASISLMPLLKVLDLSYTNIRGVIHHTDQDQQEILSLSTLQNLTRLSKLNLAGTKIMDKALDPLQSFRELTHLSLNSASLTDKCLDHISCVEKLVDLHIHGALITDGALCSFTPPPTLKVLNMRDCWLLSPDAIVLFCEKHPGIEVRHDYIGSRTPIPESSSVASAKSSRSKQRDGKEPTMSSSLYKEDVIDQRMKYRREELLALQQRASSLDVPIGTALLNRH